MRREAGSNRRALRAAAAGTGSGCALGRAAPALVACTVALFPAAAGGAGPAPTGPAPRATALAIRVVLPHAATFTSSPDTGGTARQPSVAYPKDGSVVIAGATTLVAQTSTHKAAGASASATLTNLSLFDGEITATSVAAHATATVTPRPGGGFGGTGVDGLQAFGKPHASGRVALGDWGTLTIGVHTSTPVAAAPGTTAGYQGVAVALEVRLLAPHGGLPAGAEIQVGYASASLAPAAVTGAGSQAGPLPADRPQLLPPTSAPLVGVPQVVSPELTAGPYDFPVYGQSSYSDLYGATRQGLGYQHGVDIFGELGQPLVAVATGKLYSVGWNRSSGNRLWLRDRQGNEFLYSHLSAFTLLARNGAFVHAGQVIGFMGDSGDLQGERTHLHFEVHPVSMLSLGSDGAADPAGYLKTWRRLTSLSVPPGAAWAPKVPGTIEAPQPAAVFLGGSDISTVDGLDPSALRRALTPKAGG